MNHQTNTAVETIDVKGSDLVDTVKELVHEGSVRHIVINDADGTPVLEMPVTVGVIGLLVTPTMTAVGTLGALEADYTIDVERDDPRDRFVVTDVRRPPNTRRDGTTMEQYKSILDRYVELYNAGDLDGIMELYAEDAVQGMPEGRFEGRSKIRDRLARELAAFSDLDWGVVSYVEHGDSFADEWFFIGTHTGPFQLPDGTDLPPTGKRVRIDGMELVKMRNGKIVVDNLYYDNLAVAAQLGLLPEQNTASAR